MWVYLETGAAYPASASRIVRAVRHERIQNCAARALNAALEGHYVCSGYETTAESPETGIRLACSHNGSMGPVSFNQPHIPEFCPRQCSIPRNKAPDIYQAPASVDAHLKRSPELARKALT